MFLKKIKKITADSKKIEHTIKRYKPDTEHEFLDNATHAVKDVWERVSGRKLSENELYALNDAIAAFFTDKNLLQVLKNK